MHAEELKEKWTVNIERITCLIGTEFSVLNERQLNYRVHIDRCNIRQIMVHLVTFNTPVIKAIERAIPEAKASGIIQEYEPGCIGKYLVRHAENIPCFNRKSWEDNTAPVFQSDNIFKALLDQQHQLKDLIALCLQADLNKKVVPFRFFGLIRLSLGETLEYLILQQKSHFRMARRILMLQSISS